MCHPRSWRVRAKWSRFAASRRKRKAKENRKAKVAGMRMARRYLIETFGCQMNHHDSERMAGLLEQAGYQRTADERDADVLGIHTRRAREQAGGKGDTRLGGQ